MLASPIAYPGERPAITGLSLNNKVHYQCTPGDLIRATLHQGEGSLTDTGALAIRTGKFTGRSPKDRFIVKDELTAETVNWNDFNLPIAPEHFDLIKKKITGYMNRLPEIWIRDSYACAYPRFRLNIRVVTETPWANLFAHNMFLRPTDEELEDFEPGWTVLCAPGLSLDPQECGTRQPNASVISFSHKMILIAGSGYTGEIKKGIFSILNYLLPRAGVLSMHCAANMGADGDTALFFGLSGTGKTTLSADPARDLIGDDEHGWGESSIFNVEGGCYAKTIDLDAEKEPGIFRAIRSGALVENVTFIGDSDRIDFSSRAITENTRVSYPLHFVGNARQPAIGGIPSNIFFLTCDAYGVLPPLSKLTPAQAMYQFISGYTAKVAGTETGVGEPCSTFSACFGAPFIPLHPVVYAAMLGEKIKKHHVKVWLVNTGWSGGVYGCGSRMPLAYTRAMISAAMEGKLDNVPYRRHPVFKIDVPESCPGVPSFLLNPRDTWPDSEAYDHMAISLAGKFIDNFQKYAGSVDAEILAAGPAW